MGGEGRTRAKGRKERKRAKGGGKAWKMRRVEDRHGCWVTYAPWERRKGTPTYVKHSKTLCYRGG